MDGEVKENPTKKNDKPEPEKPPRGRPVKLVMPEPIPESIARACMMGPPKDDWDYLKPGSGAKVED